MFARKKRSAVKLLGCQIDTLSDSPELGVLNLRTDEEHIHLRIDRHKARDLMEECLTLMGYPAEKACH